MEIKSYLLDYSQRTDKFLDDFFDTRLREASRLGDSGNGLMNVPAEMISMYREYMRGGKKLRGALVRIGYECGGGEIEKIIPVSAAMEIVHSYLLMHDDVMDRDCIRRGRATVHKQWEQVCRSRLRGNGESKHFGESMAYTLGDVGGFLGLGLLTSAEFSPELMVPALRFMSDFLLKTAYGQALDITYELSGHLCENDVLRIHLHKTAYYTVAGPLKLGAMMSGLKNGRLEAMEVYGKLIGTAFQLRDDELGLFGDEQVLGKPVGSDVREGKNTLLKIKAIEFAGEKDKIWLGKVYGKKDVSRAEIERVREITVKTGALEYSHKLINQYMTEGLRAVPEITDDSEKRKLLVGLADYIVKRKK
jgi:geranylgeranyl diphosphate synthase type I